MGRLPIIFAPGLMCDGSLFEQQAAHFEPGRTVSVADLSVDESIAGMAHRLLADAPQRFFLAGLSMGGIVAFEAWRQAPDRIAGLALLNTTPFADSPARREVRLSQIKRVQKGQLKTVVMEELKPNYLSAKSKQDRALLDAIYAMAERLGPDVFAHQSRALMRRADSAQTLSNISCPTTIICGGEDEVCPPELHEIMRAGIAGSTLTILPQCGHLSTMEAPDAVTKHLAEWISAAEQH